MPKPVPARPRPRRPAPPTPRQPSARGLAVGARLREARAAAGITQAALGAAVGVAQPSLAQFEAGVRVPELDALDALAQALAVRAGWLAFGEAPRER